MFQGLELTSFERIERDSALMISAYNLSNLPSVLKALLNEKYLREVSQACQEVGLDTETVPQATATATCQDTSSHSLLAARAARVSFEFVSFLTHYSYQFQSVSWFAIFLWIPGPWGAHTRLRAHSDCTRAALALRAGPAGQLRLWCSEVGCCWQNYPQASSGLKVRFQIVRWLFFVVKYAA